LTQGPATSYCQVITRQQRWSPRGHGLGLEDNWSCPWPWPWGLWPWLEVCLAGQISAFPSPRC